MGLSTSEEVGRLIAESLNRSRDIEQDAIPQEIINSMLLAPIERTKITHTVTGYQRTLNNVLIVGHPVYGEVNTYPVFMPIVLGHPVWGILGEGYLPILVGGVEFPLTFPVTFSGSYASYSREQIFTYTS